MAGFQKAVKHDAKLRAALIGPPGSGKTFTGLALGCALGGKVALVDTEHGSASKYADQFDFDVLELTSFHPKRYMEALLEAEKAGYAVVIIDSLSHAWTGKDGALELKDRAANKSGNSFTAWADVTPLQNALIDAINGSKCHVIATMRSKTDFVLEPDRNGKMVPRKVGIAAIQRDGVEYEFDLVGELDHENMLRVTKTRCPALYGASLLRPGKDLADTLSAWLKGVARQATQPANGTPAETPPVLGAEFVRQMDIADAKYASEGITEPGELLRIIRNSALQQEGCPGMDLATWSADWVAWAGRLIQKLVKDRRAARQAAGAVGSGSGSGQSALPPATAQLPTGINEEAAEMARQEERRRLIRGIHTDLGPNRTWLGLLRELGKELPADWPEPQDPEAAVAAINALADLALLKRMAAKLAPTGKKAPGRAAS